MDNLLALLMGLVEGLTEYLPVSSTGHLILAGRALGFEEAVGADLAKMFEVVIQLGAILAVVVAFPGRFVDLADLRRHSGFAGARGLMLLLLTTLPALVAGAAAHSFIKEHLFNPFTVAVGLMLGAVWIFLVERRGPRARTEGLDALGPRDALLIGLFQCLAMWPGMSRSAATILGAMMIGVERRTATQYSFFAAIPVLVAASALDLYKSYGLLSAQHVPMFAIALGASFVSALIAVKFFLRFLSQHTLVPFAWYRIALGLLVLALLPWLSQK